MSTTSYAEKRRSTLAVRRSPSRIAAFSTRGPTQAPRRAVERVRHSSRSGCSMCLASSRIALKNCGTKAAVASGQGSSISSTSWPKRLNFSARSWTAAMTCGSTLTGPGAGRVITPMRSLPGPAAT